MSKFPSFHDLLDSFTAGFIKKALVGAGLTLGTTGTVLITLNKLIDNMRDAATNLPPLAVAMADIAALDYYLSCVLGAIITKYMMKSSQLTIQRIKE